MTGPRDAGRPQAGASPAPPAARRGRDPAGGQSSAGTPSDTELLHRHVAGDPEAFGLLFLRHRDRLWAVALRTLSDPEEAADALQDAMISAFRRAGSFRGDSAVTTWLHRIVVNACLDRLRRRAARPISAGLDERSLDLLAREPQVPDHDGDFDTALEVTAALRTLPAGQRAALVLVDMLGYPVADAAGVLGVSAGTVKSRCARGRARLLPRLAHLRAGPPPAQAAGPAAAREPAKAGEPAAAAGPAPPPVLTPPAGGPAPAGSGPPAAAAAAPQRPAGAPAPGTGQYPARQDAAQMRNPALPGCVSPAEGGGDSRS